MKKLSVLTKIFISQYGPDDCGLACLAMILNYTGNKTAVGELLHKTPIPEGGFSLLDLRNLATEKSLSCRCVQMDLETLAGLNSPCIIHSRNNHQVYHFLVCYGTIKKKGKLYFLIADPATQVNLVSVNELNLLWSSKGALYFDNLTPHLYSWKDQPFIALMKIKSLRKTLLITVPLLSICGTLLGVALSWVLQRGINYPLTEIKFPLIVAIMLLLFLITLFKNMIVLIRQRILINLNSAVSLQFNHYLIEEIVSCKNSVNRVSGIQKQMSEVQKIQNGLTALVAVMFSDGLQITIITAGLLYFDTVPGFINLLYVFLNAFHAVSKSPELVSYTAQLNELNAFIEKNLNAEAYYPANPIDANTRIANHLKNYDEYLQRAQEIARNISYQNFWYECAGTINVMLIFICCLLQTVQSAISYNELLLVVILTYYMTSITPRICNSLTVVAEGGRLIQKYQKS
jgi:ABC-type bacteriocin/lantibiotic exporter with double-glycine peptidase domain